MEDWQLTALIERARSGNENAFEQLLAIFRNQIYQEAYARCWRKDDVEDLMQEVCIVVFRKIKQLHDAVAFSSWLRTTIRNLAHNYNERKKPLNVAAENVLEESAKKIHPPEVFLMEEEKKRRLLNAVSLLREIDREVLVEYYYKHRSILDIAADLNVPEGTVKRRLNTARGRLKEHLNEKKVLS